MIHFMMEDHSELVAYPKDSIFIQDGNALFHTMANLAPTFRGIVTCNKGSSHIMLQDPPTMWSHEVKWQIKNKISPLLQSLWPPNLAGCWLTMKANHAGSRMTLLSCHVTNQKSNIFCFARCMTTKLCRVVTYGEGNLPTKLRDPLITC